MNFRESLEKAPSYLALTTNLDNVACAPNWYPTVNSLVPFSLKSPKVLSFDQLYEATGPKKAANFPSKKLCPTKTGTSILLLLASSSTSPVVSTVFLKEV